MNFKPSIIFKVLVCLLLAAGAYTWATASMDAIYAHRSPLDANPPLPGAAAGSPATERVVIVLIDALRADTAAKSDVMPTLNRLRAQGAGAVMHSRPPSFSTPGYGVLLTGAWPDVSGAPPFNLDYPNIPSLRQDTIFAAASRAGVKTAISAYNYFEKLIPPADLDAAFFTAGEDQAADRAVLDAALPWLASREYGLVLIHIDQVDYAGHHEGGAASPAWDAAAARSDALLAEILAQLDLTRDTLLVISDHGQIDAGGHGGHETVTLREPFVLAGAGVRPGSYADIEMIDVAPTLAALLGSSLPAAGQGQPRTEMLQADFAADRLVAQQRNLLAGYTSAVNVPANPTRLASAASYADYRAMFESVQATRTNNERGPRAVLAAALLALFFWTLRPWKLQNGPAWLAALGVLLFFHLRHLIEGRVYSYSSLGGASDLIQLGLTGTLPGLLLAWLIIAWRQGWQRLPRAQAVEAALDLALAACFLWLWPLAAEFAWDGLLPRWTLPNFGLHYVFMISSIALLFTALGGVALAGLAALTCRPPKDA